MPKIKNLIIGAGLTGLSAAYYIGKDYMLLESGDIPGGAFTSFRRDGFILDLGERFIRINDARRKIFEDIFPKRFFVKKRLKAQVYIDGHCHDYPFQYNLWGLDEVRLKRCLKGLEDISAAGDKGGYENFNDWILGRFGRGIADVFMVPYNKKIWTVHPKRMSCDWFFDKKVVPSGDIEKIRKGAMEPSGKIKNDAVFRYYPSRGGAASVVVHMESRLQTPVRYNSRVTKVDIIKKRVHVKGGGIIDYDNLISTIPLKVLVRISSPVSEKYKKMAKKLRYNSVLCVYFALNKKMDFNDHWMYFPGKEQDFSRLFFQRNFSSRTVPDGKDVIGALITFRGKRAPVQDIVCRVKEQLEKMGYIEDHGDIDFIEHRVIKYGFCTPLMDTKKISADIRKFFESRDIYSIGRYGEWKYSGMEHALEDGLKISKVIGGR